MATAARRETTVNLADIDQVRAGILRHVLGVIMRCDHVRNVFAQIVDGLPIAKTYELTVTQRFELCERFQPSREGLELAQRFCNSDSVLENLGLNAKTAQLYQAAPINSSHFGMHLLELAGIAIHEMAANLFASFHPDGEPPLVEEDPYICLPEKSVSLSTMWYVAADRYPMGIFDAVGYWAETHVFGGVVVFDRGPEEGARKCYGAYIHPPFPADLFQLSTSQIEEFAALSEDNKFQLPFTPNPDAKKVNPRCAFLELNIYRDRYERVVSAIIRSPRCVKRLEDDPDLKEFIDRANGTFRSRE